MGNMFIGLTDFDWYTTLKNKNFDEVNFWRPGSMAFRALEPNDLFLFKLKKPYYSIVGGGFFVRYSSCTHSYGLGGIWPEKWNVNF